MSFSKEEVKAGMKMVGAALAEELKTKKKIYFTEDDIRSFAPSEGASLTLEDVAINIFYDDENTSFQEYLEPILFRGTIGGIPKNFVSVNEQCSHFLTIDGKKVGEKLTDRTGNSLVYYTVSEVTLKGLLIKKVDNYSLKLCHTEMLDDILDGVRACIGDDHVVYFGVVKHPTDCPEEYGEDYSFASLSERSIAGDTLSPNCKKIGSVAFYLSLDEKPRNGASVKPFSKAII